MIIRTATALAAITVFGAILSIATAAGLGAADSSTRQGKHHTVQLGPHSFFLVNDMAEASLKTELLACIDGPLQHSDFSIGHRGAPLKFPESS